MWSSIVSTMRSDMQQPSVCILLCTIDKGVDQAFEAVMPPMPRLSYVISVQCSSRDFSFQVPDAMQGRDDVKVVSLSGRGLSANRNHAMAYADADICIIADDDCRYSPERIDRLRHCFQANPDADVLLFQATDRAGKLLRDYPTRSFDMNRPPRGYFPVSFEIAFRNKGVRPLFDTRFGIGSEMMTGGEEIVWIHDMMAAGHRVRYVPEPLAMLTKPPKSGEEEYADERKLFSKGALMQYVYGATAWLRCVKYAWMVRRQSPFSFRQLMRCMNEGRRLISREGRRWKEKGIV